MENVAGRRPDDDRKNGGRERPRGAKNSRRAAGKNAKRVLDPAKEIPIGVRGRFRLGLSVF